MTKHHIIAGLSAAALVLSAAALFLAAVIAEVPKAHAAGWRQCGTASWYSYTGRRTASGEVYTGKAMTAAHRTLPFGARVRVTDQRTGRSIVVRLNDRGPYIKGRIIDLSPTAKRALGMGGLAKVCLERQ